MVNINKLKLNKQIKKLLQMLQIINKIIHLKKNCWLKEVKK